MFFLHTWDFVFFELHPRRGIAGPQSSSVFNFLGTSLLFSIIVRPGCTPFNSVPWFLLLHTLANDLLAFILLIIAILTSMWWYFVVVLICISLMITDVEHLFIYLLTIFMSLLEKCLFRFSVFLMKLFIILLLSCESSLYILRSNFLSCMWLENIFSHPVGCLFTLLIVCCAELFCLISPVNSPLLLEPELLLWYLKKPLLRLTASSFLMFSSCSVIVSGFMHRSLSVMSFYLCMV